MRSADAGDETEGIALEQGNFCGDEKCGSEVKEDYEDVGLHLTTDLRIVERRGAGASLVSAEMP